MTSHDLHNLAIIRKVTAAHNWEPPKKELFSVVDFLRSQIHQAFCLYDDDNNRQFIFYRNKDHFYKIGMISVKTPLHTVEIDANKYSESIIKLWVDELRGKPKPLANPCTEITWGPSAIKGETVSFTYAVAAGPVVVDTLPHAAAHGDEVMCKGELHKYDAYSKTWFNWGKLGTS